MDLIKTQNKSKNSIVLDLIRILFDVILVAGILAAIIWLQQPIVAVALVLLSKWRVLFVRLRFWWVNILANLTDVIFGLGMVALMVAATGALEVQIGLGVAYLLWNVLLKPGSKRPYILAQAAISQFVGLWAVFALAQWLALPVVLVLAAIIGFVTARHILMDYEDEDSRLVLAWSWGIVLAEVAFLAFHWTLAYSFFGLFVPQVSILTLLLSVIAWSVYNSYMNHDGKVQWGEIRWPVLFSGLLALIVTVIFGGLF